MQCSPQKNPRKTEGSVLRIREKCSQLEHSGAEALIMEGGGYRSSDSPTHILGASSSGGIFNQDLNSLTITDHRRQDAEITLDEITL